MQLMRSALYGRDNLSVRIGAYLTPPSSSEQGHKSKKHTVMLSLCWIAELTCSYVFQYPALTVLRLSEKWTTSPANELHFACSRNIGIRWHGISPCNRYRLGNHGGASRKWEFSYRFARKYTGYRSRSSRTHTHFRSNLWRTLQSRRYPCRCFSERLALARSSRLHPGANWRGTHWCRMRSSDV